MSEIAVVAICGAAERRGNSALRDYTMF